MTLALQSEDQRTGRWNIGFPVSLHTTPTILELTQVPREMPAAGSGEVPNQPCLLAQATVLVCGVQAQQAVKLLTLPHYLFCLTMAVPSISAKTPSYFSKHASLHKISSFT